MMNFRTVVRDGVVFVDTQGRLADGTLVEVIPVKPPKGARKQAPALAAPKPRKRAAPDGPLPGFGMWKDRDDWRGKSTMTIARELRRKAMGEHYRG